MRLNFILISFLFIPFYLVPYTGMIYVFIALYSIFFLLCWVLELNRKKKDNHKNVTNVAYLYLRGLHVFE
jgi:hypothetical protein